MDWKTERLKLHGLRFFFLPSPNWQQAGSPLVLMKLREDRALKCVLNVLNGTPDAFQRLTKEQLITCNWANWNQRSASVDEWWWALRGRDAVTLNHFHGLHMAEPLTPGNSVFSTECLIRRCLLQNALTRQLCLISNLLSWRQKLKSHHVFKETIRCLLSYLLPFLQTNRPAYRTDTCQCVRTTCLWPDCHLWRWRWWQWTVRHLFVNKTSVQFPALFLMTRTDIWGHNMICFQPWAFLVPKPNQIVTASSQHEES